MRVLGISGSLRRESHNTKLLRAAADLLPPGSELVEFGRLIEVPPYNEDHEHEPHDAVRELWDAVAEADAVLISTPEYNHSMPGQLKNAIDWQMPLPDGSDAVGWEVELSADLELVGAD